MTYKRLLKVLALIALVAIGTLCVLKALNYAKELDLKKLTQQESTSRHTGMFASYKDTKLKEHAKELEDFFKGAKLSKVNLDAINAQLIEVGLQMDSNNKVTILDIAQWHHLQNEFDSKKKQYVFNNMDNALNEYMQMDYFVEEEEEEEEEIVNVSNNTKSASEDRKLERIQLRHKKLSMYLLSTMNNSLKTSPKYQGKRPAGSEYVQDLIRKYDDNPN